MTTSEIHSTVVLDAAENEETIFQQGIHHASECASYHKDDEVYLPLNDLIGRRTALVGVNGDRVIVVSVKACSSRFIKATVCKSDEDIYIAIESIIYVLRKNQKMRDSFFSCSKGCEYVIRIPSSPLFHLS